MESCCRFEILCVLGTGLGCDYYLGEFFGCFFRCVVCIGDAIRPTPCPNLLAWHFGIPIPTPGTGLLHPQDATRDAFNRARVCGFVPRNSWL